MRTAIQSIAALAAALRSPRIAAMLAAFALVGVVPASQAVAHPASAPAAVAAKSCSAGYTHAVISGSEKCLRRGEYCAHSADRQYRRYGFRCVSRDSRGSYHLT
jgi:hypothetical protein